MKRGFKHTALCAILAGLAITSQAKDAPMDFQYRIEGDSTLRPVLVFNDGRDTFIQPQAGDDSIRVNGERPTVEGPYWVIRGISPEIKITSVKQGKTGKGKNAVSTETVLRSVTIRRPANAVAKAVKAASVTVAPAVVASAVTAEATPVKTAKDYVDMQQIRAAIRASNEPGVVAPPAHKSEPQPTSQAVAQKPFFSPVKPVAEPVCAPEKVRRDLAFVATFKAGATSLSDSTVEDIKKLVGSSEGVTNVRVEVERSGDRTVDTKRGLALRSALIAAGVDQEAIKPMETREPTGIGAEIHLTREITMPCHGMSVVSVSKDAGTATILWKGEAADLVPRIAKQLGLNYRVEGSKEPLMITVAVAKGSFDEGMKAVGKELGKRADLILRTDELVLKYKGHKGKTQ